MPTIAVTAGAGAVAIGAAYAAYRSAVSGALDAPGPELDIASLGERILVVAPHPDDEIMNVGGLMATARATGADVRVVLLTVGDGYRRAAERLAGGSAGPEAFLALGRQRAAESRAACAHLGLDPVDVVFLAYPDGHLSGLMNGAWREERPLTAPNGQSAVPYDFAFDPGAAYCGEGLARSLAAVVAAYRPTAVIFPDAADTHGDHRAGSAFCDRALAQVGYEGARLTYVTHCGVFPFRVGGRGNGALLPPRGVRDAGLRWHPVALTPDAVARKARALGEFRTQTCLPHMRVFLNGFARTNELVASRTL